MKEALVPTKWGTIHVTWTEKGISGLSFPGERNEETGIDDQVPEQIRQELVAYFEGKQQNFTLKVDLSHMTPFQQRVLRVVEQIPFGETRTYKWVAEQAGCPQGYRAAGQAIGANPVPIIIPCHRVIASDGSLGGFSGGLDVKKRLLRLENILTP